MAEHLFSRILRGTTKPPDDKDKNPKQSPALAKPTEEPAPVGRILDTSLTRRNVLGGAVKTVAIAGIPTLSQPSIIISQGVKEEAARLVPRIGDVLSFAKTIIGDNEPNRSSGYDSDRARRGESVQRPTIEEAFGSGIPLNSAGEVDAWAFKSISQRGKNLGLGKISQQLKLAQLKDSGLIDEAFRISGRKIGEEGFGEGVTPSSLTKQAVETLQRITGLSDDATVADLQRVFREKTVAMIGNIVERRDLLPPVDSYDRDFLFNNLQQSLEDVGADKKELNLMEKIKSERVSIREFWNDKEAARVAGYEEEINTNEQKEARIAERKRERFNRDISKREFIECKVETEDWGAHDKLGAKVFYIIPEEYKGAGQFQGLNRMHIQHLRQQLTHPKGNKKSVLDDFNPANTQVEVLRDRIRVSTTDERFQKYLLGFSDKSNRLLKIPNRLQMIVPQKQEARE